MSEGFSKMMRVEPEPKPQISKKKAHDAGALKLE